MWTITLFYLWVWSFSIKRNNQYLNNTIEADIIYKHSCAFVRNKKHDDDFIAVHVRVIKNVFDQKFN